MLSLDKIDQMLLEEMERDARQSVQALARKLGMKRTTIHHRLNRLRDQGVLTIACMVNSELMGYQFLFAIGIDVAPGKVEVVANQLMPVPAVKVVSLTTGRYSILAWAVFRDRLAFSHFVSETLEQLSDITGIEVMHCFEWVRNAWGYFKPQMRPSGTNHQDILSDLDLAIIRAMQLDPRQPITRLAKAVGCGRLVAKKRLEKLLSNGVIEIVNTIDLKALGNLIRVIILVKAKPDKIHAVANELSAQGAIRLVTLVTGQWQILAAAQFEDNGNLYKFLLETLPSIPGITGSEVIHQVKTLKYSKELP